MPFRVLSYLLQTLTDLKQGFAESKGILHKRNHAISTFLEAVKFGNLTADIQSPHLVIVQTFQCNFCYYIAVKSTTHYEDTELKHHSEINYLSCFCLTKQESFSNRKNNANANLLDNKKQ